MYDYTKEPNVADVFFNSLFPLFLAACSLNDKCRRNDEPSETSVSLLLSLLNRIVKADDSEKKNFVHYLKKNYSQSSLVNVYSTDDQTVVWFISSDLSILVLAWFLIFVHSMRYHIRWGSVKGYIRSKRAIAGCKVYYKTLSVYPQINTQIKHQQ